ncbi:phage portal protein, partial [Clostridioides difficile]|nr:phage portal protein [Clostridioides difficile]HBG2624315.1 phage portal protein [Clostridioides difficile]
MSNLSAFLAQNAIKVDNVKYIASNRFLDEDNKPVEWELRVLSSEEDEALRR